jgi:Mg2+-importing ATPase
LGALGVRIKIVSGDAAPVLLHLVETLGLPCKGLLTGKEIEELDHPGLVARVRDVDLYARVSPRT